MPDISLAALVMLCLAAAAAGWIDAVVGGGGLLFLPALLIGFPHLPPAHLLGTNKAVAIVGTSAAAGLARRAYGAEEGQRLRARSSRRHGRGARRQAGLRSVGVSAVSAGGSAAERLPFFVYGTLRPAGRYYRRYLQGRTAAEEPARLPGAALYEGPGYPYAIPAPDGEVLGALVLPAAEEYDVVLAELDWLEDGYERVVREAVRGDGAVVRAWVYFAAEPLAAQLRAEGRRVAHGDWLAHR